MPLGLESGRVRVVPYDADWPALYAAEIARLTPFLQAAGLELVLEHTGSTAVPGLAAKPIVDILAGLPLESAREPAIIALQTAGYVHRGEQGIPGRNFFRRGEPRQYHLHLTRVGSTFWDDHRHFRDWLRTHPVAAAEYAALKQALAARYPTDREAYIDAKTAFVEAVLRTARESRTPPSP
ncbi:MAG TPA: GrpB family protein [Gemmatimonadaceae bacterium]|nr:GrpB family protein [Gemmatimonadaceae bacterium]